MQTSFSKWSKMAGMGAVAMIAMYGCTGSDTNGDGQTADSAPAAKMQAGVDAAQNVASGAVANSVDAAGNVVSAAGDVADNAVDVVGNAADTAGAAASNAASGATAAGRAAVMTPNVKEAIGDKIPNSAIDVDTNGTTKTITLKGTVANAAQIKLAGDTAKKEAPGYKIVNNLKAGGKTSPMMKKP